MLEPHPRTGETKAEHMDSDRERFYDLINQAIDRLGEAHEIVDDVQYATKSLRLYKIDERIEDVVKELEEWLRA